MKQVSGKMSTYIALALLAASAFMAQPTLASLFEHIFVIPALLVALVITSHFEAYKEARDEFAPGKPIQGHLVYRFVEWLETPHLGIKGVWIIMVPLTILVVYTRFR